MVMMVMPLAMVMAVVFLVRGKSWCGQRHGDNRRK